jgi:hypothetical protein
LPLLVFRDNVMEEMNERDEPEPVSAAVRRTRIRRIRRIGNRLGFVGRIEYRHVHSQSGGAQYCIGPSADDDLIVVYAEAFERDADPKDFRLEAMIAHECGHQKLIRDPTLRMILARFPGEQLEEILASLVGSLLLGETETSQTLVWKATVELGELGMSAAKTVQFIERLRRLLRHFL